jgi:BirA family transcriptional regulator, biotin operon repressor / biotin---[acetyl-CoA-carboxylase] ligase
VIYEGLEPSDLASRWAVPRCVVLQETTSTLDVIHELAAAGAPANTLVLADEQTRGRGRRRDVWVSARGQGVLSSFLFRPPVVTPIGVLSLRVGLAVVATFAKLGIDAKLKWPNDILADDRKVCGILCEARWNGNEVAWIAVGIGINVHGPLPVSIRDHAAALSESSADITRLAVLDVLVPRICSICRQGELSTEEQREFERHDWLVNRRITEPIVGTARGVDTDGALLVWVGSRMERVIGGHVVAA